MFSRCKWDHRKSSKLQINHIHSISEQPVRAFRKNRFWMIFVDKLCFLLIVHLKKMTTKEWFNLFVVQILEKNYYTINVVTKHLILKRLHNVFFLIPQQRHQSPKIKLKLIVDEISINENGNICGAEVGVTVRCSVDPIFYWCDRKCARSTAARALGTAPRRCREACLACNTDQDRVLCHTIQPGLPMHFFFNTPWQR